MSLMRTFKLAAVASAVIMSSPAWSQQSAPQSLNQAVEQAILTHPEIRARFHDFLSSLEGQKVVRGGMLPQVSAQGWVGREYRNHVPDSPSYDWSRPGYSLELRQLLFDGFTTYNNYRQLGFEKLSSYFELLATTDALANEAVDAYLDVQRYREMEALARDNFRMHENTLSHLRERQESGVGRGVDLEQAYGRLALAQTNLITESNNLNDVTQRYRRSIGDQPAPALEDAPDVASQLPDAPESFLESVRVNPSLLSKQALVQAAEKGKQAATGTMYSPTLEFRASTGTDRENPGRANRDIQSSRIQLVMSYNLFRGGSDAARVRQTSAQMYAARDVRDYTCRNVQQELAIAWNNVMRLRNQLPFLQEHELATSKVRTAYQQQFQIGQRSLLDLLDTENELFDARRALLNGTYDLKKAEYRWLSLSNRVLPALGIAQPHNEEISEASDFLLPEESLKACVAPVPDTSNLAPVSVEYRDDMRPPVVHTGARP